jgi:hypothetical protein
VVLHYLKNINILDHSDPAPICHLKLGCSPIAAYLCLSTQLRRISMLMSLSVFSARLLGASSRHVSLSISHRIFSARPLWARLHGACVWACLCASSMPVLSGRVFSACVSGLVPAPVLCPSSLGASSRRVSLGVFFTLVSSPICAISALVCVYICLSAQLTLYLCGV